jgi:AcrR family transcriptional regulator
MEIARAAAGLFVRHGLRATRAEDIAQAAGIAPRTFYRYFATKEEAVAPLYAAGAQRWAEAVRAAPADVGVIQALEQGVRHTLTPGVGVSAASWEWVRALLRLAEATPSLRRVWAEVCQASERLLGEVLAERVTRAGASGTPGAAVAPEDGDNVAAALDLPSAAPADRTPLAPADLPSGAAPDSTPAAASDSTSVATRDVPSGVAPDSTSVATRGVPSGVAPDSTSAAASDSTSVATRDLPSGAARDSTPAATRDLPSAATPHSTPAATPDLPSAATPHSTPAAPRDLPPAATPDMPCTAAPELRFAAAVASAAVRAALEAWAAGDGPVEGPGGPAELALRNLAALRDFPWGA